MRRPMGERGRVPTGSGWGVIPLLGRAWYVHGAFEASDPALVADALRVRADVPPSSDSRNMHCDRYFFESEAMAARVLAGLVRAGLGGRFSRVLPSMRVLDYPSGGYIRPHTDGVQWDAATASPTTTSFLLYLADSRETGATNFLAAKHEGAEVLATCRPRRGSLLVFPHAVPHEGLGVGAEGKLVLRGDLY